MTEKGDQTSDRMQFDEINANELTRSSNKEKISWKFKPILKLCET